MFKFRLAMAWGCSVEELEDRLPQCELPYWIAFYRLEPFGGDVTDTQFAQIGAIFANAHRTTKRQPFKVEDFKLAKRVVKKTNILDQVKAFAKLIRGH